MVRVISHEIKNSLTPIKSLTQTLLNKDDISENNKRALTVINQRSNSLHRLIDSYSVVTKSIRLKPTHFNVAVLTNRLSKLYGDLEISDLGDDIEVFADSTLLEQVLINLIKNAVEASEEAGSSERVTLQITEGLSPKKLLKFQVSDRGTGIEQTENLFVPFYSTKPE
jgi:signal transduction histidine kinase